MSRWAEVADRAIAQVLDRVPAGAPLKEIKAAVSAAYPFGERRMHPYKIWLKRVALALAPFERREQKPKDDEPFIVLHERRQLRNDRGEYVRRVWWLAVECEWCQGKLKGGCLKCKPLHDEIAALLADSNFAPMLAALRRLPTDYFLAGIMADWLEENHHEDIGRLFREQWAKHERQDS